MPGFANALPHWTVEEYVLKLELFLGGEFTINHRGRSIDFAFTDDIVASLPPVELDSIIDDTIINYFNDRLTNASAESFNAKIKELKRQFPVIV